MFCPSCAEKNDIDQKFCRRCGLNLEQTAISVREQAGDAGVVELTRQERYLATFGTIAFGGFGVVIAIAVLGIIYAIIANMIWNGKQPLYGVLLVAFVVFAFLSLGYVFWNESLKERRAKLSPSADPILDAPATTGKLTDGADFEPVPSVTEHTTTALDAKILNRESR